MHGNLSQPSQLYISKDKLDRVMEWIEGQEKVEYEPLPVKELNGKVIFTDGHTRAFALYLLGYIDVKVYWDNDDMSWEAYQICVDWCVTSSITSIADLRDRIIDKESYNVLWINRCDKMHNLLGI